MSDDDNELNEDALEPAEDAEFEAEAEVPDLDEIDVDEVDLEGPDEEVFEEDDETFTADDDAEVDVVEDDEDDDDDAETTARTRKRKGEEDDDEDEDMLAPDDVEADLDRILKDRMVTSEDEDDDDEDDEDDGAKGKAGGEAVDGLQPKRADEILCTTCFLLVRSSAPGCPVEDDACPIFN